MTSNRDLKRTGVNQRRAHVNTRHGGTTAEDNLVSFNYINPVNRNQPVPLPTNYLHQSSLRNHGMQNGRTQIGPPPLPPRPNQAFSSTFNRYPGISGYSNYYSPYSPFSSGLYSPYGYRTPYSRFGTPEQSNFVQLAEESSRPAFESIESVVQVVSSVSMMLESTYHAVHSSYSAILGVVDQFSRLKEHLAQVLSFLAVLRGLRWICLKLLYLLKLRKDNPSVESAWKSAEKVTSSSDSFGDNSQSPWPFFVFLSLAIGAPWLMFKLLTRNIGKKPFDTRLWLDETGSCLQAVAAYDFTNPRPGEIAFHAGEKLRIAPKHLQRNTPRGWFLACNKDKKTGFIPSNYLLPNEKKNDYPKHKMPARGPHSQSSYLSEDLGNEMDIVPPTNLQSSHEATQEDSDFQSVAHHDDISQFESNQEAMFETEEFLETSQPKGSDKSGSQVNPVQGTFYKTDSSQEIVSPSEIRQETNSVPSEIVSKLADNDVEQNKERDCF